MGTAEAIPAILIALTIHELSHGYVAKVLGDDTAERKGRLTLNPIAHIDPFGALMLLFGPFGWAKPVPVNPMNFTNPIEEIITINKKTKSVKAYYSIALNELTEFDSLVSDTTYYWRVKPNYIYRTSRYPFTPSSFIYNPTYSTPSPVLSYSAITLPITMKKKSIGT